MMDRYIEVCLVKETNLRIKCVTSKVQYTKIRGHTIGNTHKTESVTTDH